MPAEELRQDGIARCDLLSRSYCELTHFHDASGGDALGFGGTQLQGVTG